MRWAGAGSSCSHIAAGGSLAVDVLGVGSAVSGVLWHCEARLARLYCSNCETRAQSLLLRVAGGCCLAEAHDDGHGKRDDELCGDPPLRSFPLSAPSLLPAVQRRPSRSCQGASLQQVRHDQTSARGVALRTSVGGIDDSTVMIMLEKWRVGRSWSRASGGAWPKAHPSASNAGPHREPVRDDAVTIAFRSRQAGIALLSGCPHQSRMQRLRLAATCVRPLSHSFACEKPISKQL